MGRRLAPCIAACLVVGSVSCVPRQPARSSSAAKVAAEAQARKTEELIERVARLELGIRRHRELAAKRDESVSGELEKILSGIVRLASTRQATPKATLELLPGVVYAVPIAGAPADGPRHAAVTLVVAIDFTCPFCESLQGTLDALRTEYKSDLKVVYQTLLTAPNRELGRNAALAHCAASRQGRGASMRTELWREHRVGLSNGDLAERFSPERLAELAVTLGVRRRAYNKDLAAPCSSQLDIETERFEKLSVAGAPTAFVNGRVVLGPQRIETYRATIEAELVRAKRARASGVKLRHYYDLLVATGSETATPVTP